jgi:uncharacterized protein (TIGR02145 family)
MERNLFSHAKTLLQRAKRKMSLFLSILAILFANGIANAQVTVGADKVPETFSALEIVSNSTKGLRLPQLTTAQREAITTSSFKANPLAEGLQIFNTETKCVNTWNGQTWIENCASGCTPPSITGYTSAQYFSLYEGQTATFGFTASGSPTLSYQWYNQSGIISGATNSSYTTPPLSMGVFFYYCIVTSSCDGSTVRSDYFVVDAASNCSPPTIVSYTPTSREVSISEGRSATLGVLATGGPILSYQWYNDQTGAIISGATGSTYTTPALSGGTYAYRCAVTASCNSVTVSSLPFTVVASSVIPPYEGEGSLTGRSCLDIVKTASAECGDLASRLSGKIDFSNHAQNPQTYTFTATTNNVSNVRFYVVDNEGCVLSTSNTNPVTGTLAQGASTTFDVTYRKDLNHDHNIIGRNRNNAAIVQIYAIYYNGSHDVYVKFEVRIQDCACCGANVAANTWKEFMCYNLGADYTADPFTPSYKINGAYYQWGRKEPAASAPNASGGDAIGIAWNSTAPSGFFGNGTSGTDIKIKSIYDPCPTGYRIPSKAEWDGVKANNTRTAVGTWMPTQGVNGVYWSGVKYGPGLLLPAAGNRSYANGALNNRGWEGFYWSTAQSEGSSSNAFAFTFIKDGTNEGTISWGIGRGQSIRCISEY